MTGRSRKTFRSKPSPKGRQRPKKPHENPRVAALARKCWKVVNKLSVAVVGSKIEAYWLIGSYLNRESASSHVARYEQYVVRVFIREWKGLGGFPLGEASAKYARQLASKFDHLLLGKAISGDLNWSAVRQLLRAGVTPAARSAVVNKAYLAACKRAGKVPGGVAG